MPAMNVLANLFVTIYNTEARRKGECVVLPTSKIGTNDLETLKKDMAEVHDGVKDADVMYQFRNMIYYYADNASEK